MSISRLALSLLMVASFAGCGERGKPLAPASSERPTPIPVLPAPFKLGFAPAYARGAIILLGESLKPELLILTEFGEVLPAPSGLAFISRNPQFVTVDSTGLITANALGSAWIVASLPPPHHVLRDSIQVTVRCTLELWIEYNPRAATLRVGESFIPSLTLLTCGRRLKVEDTFWWRSHPSTDVIQVDSATGKATAIKPGQGWVVAIGQRGNAYPALPVTVMPPG